MHDFSHNCYIELMCRRTVVLKRSFTGSILKEILSEIQEH